ncbi:PPC domain-containing DNA-binding protein, partial [Hydrogenophaga sp.]
MKTLPIRLTPGQDLREALEAAVRAQGCQAAFVLSGIGSLVDARIRFAGADE